MLRVLSNEPARLNQLSNTPAYYKGLPDIPSIDHNKTNVIRFSFRDGEGFRAYTV